MERRTMNRVCGLVAVWAVLGAGPAAQAQVIGELGRWDVSVGSAAFADDTGSAFCRVARGLYAYYRPDPEAVEEDCDLVAPIALPDGARLASLRCSLYDAEPANAMEGHLIRVDLETGDLGTIFITPGTVDSGSIQVLSDATPVPGTDRVDNRRYAYYLAAAFSQTDFTQTGNAMRVYGCSVRLR